MKPCCAKHYVGTGNYFTLLELEKYVAWRFIIFVYLHRILIDLLNFTEALSGLRLLLNGWKSVMIPVRSIQVGVCFCTWVMRAISNCFQHPADEGAESIEFPVVSINHLAIASKDCLQDFQRAVGAGAVVYVPQRAKDKGVNWDGSPRRMRLGPEGSLEVHIAYLKGPDGEIIELLESSDL